MPEAQVNSELVNDILVIHVTDKLIPFRGLLNLLKKKRTPSGVIIHNKVPDYIPDQYSIGYLLDLVSSPFTEKTRLAIIPFTNLQQAMFELVFDEFNKSNVEINYFQEMNPALSWLHS
ncbi:MAG: hypothetical protein MUE70_12460 [Desulfobacterales bacterium]|jgi:hypothetical protein|nr:hypothetical protein [Desulfobacterales bacterium]